MTYADQPNKLDKVKHLCDTHICSPSDVKEMRLNGTVSGTPPGPEEKNSQDSSAGKAYDVLCDMRDSATRILDSHLSAAGFSDLTENELLILAAMYLNMSESRSLVRQLGISGQIGSQSVEKMILHGYLDFIDNPDRPRQAALTITEKGIAAFEEAEGALKADR